MPSGARYFSLLQNVQPHFGAHPASIQWVPGVKRTGREVDRSPPSGAEAKNEWGVSSSPLIRLHGVERGNFACVHYFQTYV